MSWSDESLEKGRSLQRLLDDLRLQPRKRWGQNFLTDDNILKNIIRLLPERQVVWEIGAGLGALTRHLINLSQRLFIFEVDPRLVAYLQLRISQPYPLNGVELIAGNVVNLWQKYWQKEGTPDLLVANLPYNIASTLLAKFARQGFRPQLMVLMVQRELATRLTALPNTPEYNALSLFCQLQYSVKFAFEVGGKCFYPQTQVRSQVLVLEPQEQCLDRKQQDFFYNFVHSLFSHRRKTIANNMKKTGYAHLLNIVIAGGWDAERRAQEYSLQDYIRLVCYLWKHTTATELKAIQ